MAWNLKGSYVETCSCELMCPCNLTFDHGATYDYCRVTLVFDVREGEIEGTDVAGLKVAAIVDSPKVMTEGNWRIGVFVDEEASDEQAGQARQGLQRPARRPDGGARSAHRRDARRRARSDRGRRRRARHSVRVGDVIDFEIEDIVPFGASPASRSGSTGFPPGRVGPRRWPRRSGRRSTRSASSTRARPGLSTSEFSWAA